MLVGMCKIDLLIGEGHSLKEKRQVIKSLVHRLQNRFNISAAEVGYLDMLRRSEIGFAAVSNESAYLDKIITEAISFVERDSRVEIINTEREVFIFNKGQ